ncbi:hypothetical protein M0220_13470 [Halomonas qinghailakensis]|uniref:Uncharacterized protein n=1 Tax=Halomonas qinghailakensis TaxID=2937790 RepID=A0AA46TNZ5_9GAMM|nr:hypothetical protein [Halomonas sp. ZZQ-149]UYO73878.1 hypothetical protein M0220_13470 [Halomonas sp. ZZQ-149]
MTNIKHPGLRVIDRFKYTLKYYDSLDMFAENLKYESCSCSIALKDTSLDIELHLKKARHKKLVVMLGGAKVNQDWGKEGPFFLGREFSKSIESNILFISDPSFAYDKNIKLGWYLGTKKSNGQEAVKRLIDIVVQKFNIEKLIFFGGSGGGFASMQAAHHFPDSISIVWNPQIDVLNYHVKEVTKETFELAYDASPTNEINGINLDISNVYNEHTKNKVIYWQNLTDHHVKEQLNPFLSKQGLLEIEDEFIGWVNDWLFLFVTNIEKRHTPPPKNILLKILQFVVNNDINKTSVEFLFDSIYTDSV